MSTNGSRQLVICGMHRSGTSLVASLVQGAGMDIGSRLIGSDVGNPRGHFEDHDFVRLHEGILAAAGRTWLTSDAGVASAAGDGFEAQARSLIAARADRPLWGWKDPRTSLFLEFWDRLLPQPSYLFVYRHPVDVALSLRRRDATHPRTSSWLALRAWVAHNRELFRFYDLHAHRSYLARISGVTADVERFVAGVAAKLHLPLRGDRLSSLYHPEEIAPPAVERHDLWERLIPDALDLFRQLDERADLRAPDDGNVTSTARPPRRGTPELELYRELGKAGPRRFVRPRAERPFPT